MKNIIKKIAVPALASGPISSLAIRLLGRGIPVFMIHRMIDEKQNLRGTTRQHLRQCLQYLKNNDYTFISLQTLIESINTNQALPEKAIVFTMDDGFIDQAEVAVPIFLEFNCPITFFVITGMLDNALWPWDAQISWIIDNTEEKELNIQLNDELVHIKLHDNENRHPVRESVRNLLKEIAADEVHGIVKKLADSAKVTLPVSPPASYQAINWDLARDLEKRGVTFAPHSRSHQILSKLDSTSCSEEILGSWQTLQKELSHPLNVFCYPTGRALDFGPREINILKQANFIGAVATTPGYVSNRKYDEHDLFKIPRFELPDNMVDFIQYCSWIEYAKFSR